MSTRTAIPGKKQTLIWFHTHYHHHHHCCIDIETQARLEKACQQWFSCVCFNLGSSSHSSRNGNNDRFEAPPNFAEPVGAGFLQSTSSRSALSAPKALLGPGFWRGSLWALLRDRKERPLGAFSLGSLPKGSIRLQGKKQKVENSWSWSQFVHNRNKKLITVCRSVHNHNIAASQHAVSNIFSLLMCCHHMSNYIDHSLFCSQSQHIRITACSQQHFFTTGVLSSYVKLLWWQFVIIFPNYFASMQRTAMSKVKPAQGMFMPLPAIFRTLAAV